MEDKNQWVTMKLCDIWSSDGPVYLNIGLDSNINESFQYGTNYNLFRIFFQIKDNRAESNSRIQIDLGYLELHNILKQLNSISRSKESYDNAVKINQQASIVKSSGKNYKRLTFEFGEIQGKRLITVSIKDQTSSVSVLSINIEPWKFASMLDIMRDVKANFSVLSTNTFIVCNQERYFRELDSIQSKWDSKLEDINSFMTTSNGFDKNEVATKSFNSLNEFDPTLYDSDSTSDNSDEDQVNFIPDIDSELSSDLDIFSNTTINDDKPKKNNSISEKPCSPFISEFLNNDIHSLSRLKDKFTLTNDKSDSILFTPHLVLLNLYNKDDSIFSEKEKEEFYLSQYYSIVTLKKNVVKYNMDNSLNKYPIWKFPKNCYDYPYLMDIMKCSFICMIVYNNIVTNYINKLNNPSGDVDQFKLTREFIKMVLGPFIVTIKDSINTEDDKENFINEIWNTFLEFKNSGSFDKLKEEYSKVTMNGSFDMTFNIFHEEAKKLISHLPKIKYISIDNYESECNSDISFPDKMNSQHEIKNHIVNVLHLSTKEKQKEVDKRLKRFLDWSSDLIEEKLYDEIKSKCSSFDDLDGYIDAYDLPKDVKNIKKTMDENPNITRKDQLEKELNKMNNDTITENTDDDWNSILFGG